MTPFSKELDTIGQMRGPRKNSTACINRIGEWRPRHQLSVDAANLLNQWFASIKSGVDMCATAEDIRVLADVSNYETITNKLVKDRAQLKDVAWHELPYLPNSRKKRYACTIKIAQEIIGGIKTERAIAVNNMICGQLIDMAIGKSAKAPKEESAKGEEVLV